MTSITEYKECLRRRLNTSELLESAAHFSLPLSSLSSTSLYLVNRHDTLIWPRRLKTYILMYKQRALLLRIRQTCLVLVCFFMGQN